MSNAEWVLLLSRGQFALTMGMHITPVSYTHLTLPTTF